MIKLDKNGSWGPTSSIKDALIFNGKGLKTVNPWRIVIDTNTPNEHSVGADNYIKVVGGSLSVYCLSKSDARKIKEILLAYNEQGGGNTLTIV